MHIGGFNFLQQNKASDSAEAVGTASATTTSASSGILKEFNKNTSSDVFKANKKYKFGHVNKSFEPSSAYGNVHDIYFSPLNNTFHLIKTNIYSLI